VKTVVLFGSYATDAPRVGDVDVAVELEARFPTHSPEQKALEATRRDTEHYHPRNLVEEIGWGMVEVYRVLQGRSPTLSVCEWGAMPPLPPGTPYRVILGEWNPGSLWDPSPLAAAGESV
jgi:predicted nucleotidyltransferase